MAVISAANRYPIVACRRLNPDIFESRFACEPPVCNAIERHAARQAQVLRSGRFAQPGRTFQKHLLRVVLDAPREVLPMLHRGTALPVRFAFNQQRLVKLHAPIGDAQFAVLHVDQRGDRTRPAVRCQAHHLTAFVPVGKDVA